jgi:hypothetical protein
VLDFWLTTLWQRLGCPDVRYIQIPWMMYNINVPTPDEISAFRTAYGLPLQGPCEKAPLAGLLNTGRAGASKGGNHYCCVIWMPEERIVHVLGRNYMSTGWLLDAKNWAEWDGPTIWRNLAILHGWSCSTLSVRTLDWIQNGYDCGPIACQVLERIWTTGFELTSTGIWRKPSLPCCHQIRLQIASDTHACILAISQANPQQHTDGTLQSVVQELENHPARRLHLVTRNLHHAMAKCSLCITSSGKKSQKKMESPHVSRPFISSIPSRDLRRAKGRPECDAESDDGGNDSGRSSTSLPSDTMPSHANRNIHVKDWSQARLGRFPRPPPPYLPKLKSLRGLWSKFDNNFDDYDDGPTLEDLEATGPPKPIQLANADLVYMAHRIISNPWPMFKDQGFRILPSFADLFYKKSPIRLLEHISPVGLSHPSFPPSESDSEISSSPDDLITVGAQEMLEAVGSGDDNLMFLTGKTPDNRYIQLDLRRDAVIPQSICHSYDIDSLIWVSTYPRFRHAVSVYTMPLIRKKPPIWKHNHVYVDLLVPQSETDRLAPGRRSEWWTRRFRLSRIPHVSFGRIGEGSGSIDIYLFFPRMTHRHPHTGRWVSLVPSDVQNFLWKKVITPAMKNITRKSDHPYVGLSRENLILKMGTWSRKRRGEGQRVPTFPFRPSLFQKLMNAMMEIVCLALNLVVNQLS